jgi:TRAP-type C4-dicarboxylate transport system substrate-binding protein
MPNAETYAALEKGVVDGACWTSIGILPAKFYEVNKYLVRPTFGPSNILILMNLNRWKGLSAEDRMAVDEAARTVEKGWVAHFRNTLAEEEAALIKDHGMKITRMREDIASKVDAIMAEGTWALSAGRNARMTEDLKTFARSKGLLH